jgi:hypothetical protein
MQKVLADALGAECLPAKALGWVNGHVTGSQLEEAVQDEIAIRVQ